MKTRLIPLAAVAAVLLAAPVFSRVTRYAATTWEETVRAKARHRFRHLTDITVVKLYDHYKWQSRLARTEKYARENAPAPVVEALDARLADGNAVVTLRTGDGKQGYLMVAFPFPDAARFVGGIDEPGIDSFGGAMEVVVGSGKISIRGGNLEVMIATSPFAISVRGKDGRVLAATPGGSGLELGPGLCRASLLMVKGERFIGGGEQYTGIDHHGRVVIMDTDDAYQTRTGNTYIPVPMFISSRGMGLFVNTWRMARFDFGRRESDRLFFENPGPDIDCVLFFSMDPRRIIMEQSALVGRAHLVPRWSLEPWICRRTWLGWRYDQGARQDIDTMIQQGFPLGVVMWENLTMTSHEGVDLRVDEVNKPGAPELIDYWHGLGIKVAGYNRAGTLNAGDRTLSYYGFDRHTEYLVRNPDGTLYLGGYGGDKVYIDVTNPLALEYAWDKVFGPLFSPAPGGGSSFERLDLDGTKVDFGEYFPPDGTPLLMADRRPGMRLYQPTMFSEWLYEKINEVRPGGGITWVRGAGLGAQSTGIVWAGDRGRTFVQHRETIIAGLNAAASGVSLWGTDLGGYTGGGMLAEQVYNRGVAFSCFSPSFHDHGSAIAPWEQSERGRDIYRFYARLRYNLIPYIYHYLWEAHDKGLPVLRPMIMECPDDEACWKTDDQYFLGDDLLVAPVVENARRRKVYLPAGEWIDFFTREKRSGPAVIDYPVPLETIPVFVRSGAAVPVELNRDLQPGGAFAQEEKDRLTPGFLVYAQGDFEIGGKWKTRDPRAGGRVETRVKMKRIGGMIEVEEIEPGRRAMIVYGPEPQEVRVKGSVLEKADSCGPDSGKTNFWCYRGSDRAAVIRIGGGEEE